MENEDLGFVGINPGASAEDIRYRDFEYKDLSVRQVIKDGKPSGVYHLRSKGKVKSDIMVSFFKDKMPDRDIGLIDPGDILGLNYKVYFILNNDLSQEDILDGFKYMDAAFRKYIKDINGFKI